MLKHRVIPALLLRNKGLVKTTQFDKPVYVGDPLNAIRIFNEKEVDELLVLDIMATRDGRGPDFEAVKEFAGECFMPLCYGGGITSLADAERLFALGVEKVSVQAAAFLRPSLIEEIAKRFGSQAVVASVDIKTNWRGQYHLFRAPETAARQWQQQLGRLIDAGAGEILLTAVDREGTMAGVDTKLIRMASDAISVPLIACGGVGSLGDIKNAVDAGANAVAAGAFFVFHGKHRAVLITYPNYSTLEELLAAA